jgi:hypothetical protein
VRAVTTAGFISIALNILGAAFTFWVLRRVSPLIKEIVQTRTKLADTRGELILANGRTLAMGEKLLETQMQLKDALNDAAVQKGMREMERASYLEKIFAAETRAAQIAARVPIARQTIYVPGLDDKTKSLVRLAVDNPEKNEGTAAALLVCKRLKERMDG